MTDGAYLMRFVRKLGSMTARTGLMVSELRPHITVLLDVAQQTWDVHVAGTVVTKL
jgi:tRNA U54 and U55 pseudouridine synthase Pus10